MRWLKLTVASLTAALILSAPAFAQSAADSQYDDGPSTSEFSTADIPKTLADNAADGSGAVNDALAGSGSSGEPAVASGSVAGLTMLPETGGASLVRLVAGLFLSAAGVLSLIRRTNP